MHNFHLLPQLTFSETLAFSVGFPGFLFRGAMLATLTFVRVVAARELRSHFPLFVSADFNSRRASRSSLSSFRKVLVRLSFFFSSEIICCVDCIIASFLFEEGGFAGWWV